MFHYSNQDLYCENVALADIAHQAGTPAYVYSSAAILENYRAYDEALGELPHTVCYAVKANSSLGILALLAKAGAGFDIVSGGELYRVLRAGGDPAKVVFSGVGKTAGEVDYALESGIHMFNCESDISARAGNCIACCARAAIRPKSCSPALGRRPAKWIMRSRAAFTCSIASPSRSWR